MASFTWWQRLEPIPYTGDFAVSLAASIRDPLWFLTRQWQIGEFTGQDAGSAAYVEYSGRSATIPKWTVGTEVRDIDAGAPLEPQTLAEPFSPDLGLRVELGHDFADFLAEKTTGAAVTERLIDAFMALDPYGVRAPADDNELSPLDGASKRFLAVCVGRALDGYQLFLLGEAIAGGSGSVPAAVTTNADEVTAIKAALDLLVEHAGLVYGDIGTADPATWRPDRLEYDVSVTAVDPAGAGSVRLDAHPDSRGQYDWFSFDAAAHGAAALDPAPEPIAFTTTPSHVRFDGMPNPRFWMFEPNTLSYVDLKPDKRDLMKLLVADFMLIHGAGWYVLPIDQKVGTLVRTDCLLVHDVFGYDIRIERAEEADRDPNAPERARWTMFSTTDPTTDTEVAGYFVLPPAPGQLLMTGTVLEDVRFARDETANMAWAVERLTQSAIGEARSGRERDPDIAARQNLPEPAPAASGAPLRYLVESQVPANWIPLVGVPLDPGHPENPSIALEKGGVVRPTTDAAHPVAVVPALSKIMNPTGAPAPYHILEEEVPRAGTRVERVVFRSRWMNGTRHLWVQRRRLAGAGESQAGLRFDQALPNKP